MKISLLADYDFNAEITDGLLRREPSVDLKPGHDAGLEGVPDSDVLVKAANEGRILITHDHRTMPNHFGQFLLVRSSPGVFIIPQQMSIGGAIEELLLIWTVSEAEEWANRILYLPL